MSSTPMKSLLATAMIMMAGVLHAAPTLVLEIAGEGVGETGGTVSIDLRPDLAPKHVEQIVTLVGEGAYDDVAFHRVMDGFMAQTGDVQYGKVTGDDIARAGTGGSKYPDLPAEFTDFNYDRGVVGMARSQHPDSANSQFFIMLDEGSFLNNQYTVVGVVTEGMDIVDAIKKGDLQKNGKIDGAPDYIAKASIVE